MKACVASIELADAEVDQQLEDLTAWIRSDVEGEPVRSSWRPTRQRFDTLVWQSDAAKLNYDLEREGVLKRADAIEYLSSSREAWRSQAEENLLRGISEPAGEGDEEEEAEKIEEEPKSHLIEKLDATVLGVVESWMRIVTICRAFSTKRCKGQRLYPWLIGACQLGRQRSMPICLRHP